MARATFVIHLSVAEVVKRVRLNSPKNLPKGTAFFYTSATN